MSLIYEGFQIDLKNTAQEISIALQQYIQKHGLPEQILLESGLESVPLPEGMNIVVKSERIPKNIILIGSME